MELESIKDINVVGILLRLEFTKIYLKGTNWNALKMNNMNNIQSV